MKYKLLSLITVLALAITSCKKDGDLAPVAPVKTLLNVINAGTDTVNVFQNGTRINNSSAYFPGGTLSYLPVTEGEQSFQIKKAGTPTVLVDVKHSLPDSTYNSLFIAGPTADKVFFTRDSIFVDTLPQIRYVNASPEASYDVKVGTAFNYANRPFKSKTDFIRLAKGKVVLTVSLPGSATPLVTRTLTLEASRAYTIYTKGKVGGTGNNAFGAVLISNY